MIQNSMDSRLPNWQYATCPRAFGQGSREFYFFKVASDSRTFQREGVHSMEHNLKPRAWNATCDMSLESSGRYKENGTDLVFFGYQLTHEIFGILAAVAE